MASLNIYFHLYVVNTKHFCPDEFSFRARFTPSWSLSRVTLTTTPNELVGKFCPRLFSNPMTWISVNAYYPVQIQCRYAAGWAKIPW